MLVLPGAEAGEEVAVDAKLGDDGDDDGDGRDGGDGGDGGVDGDGGGVDGGDGDDWRTCYGWVCWGRQRFV